MNNIREDILAKMIIIDSDEAQTIGYTSDVYTNNSQFFKHDKCLYIPNIQVHSHLRGKGNWGRLCERVLELGDTIKVVNPTNRRFYNKLIRMGFQEISEPTLSDDGIGEDVVMMMEPKKQ